MIKVGCCGYPTSTKKYQENFGLVELNITFYRYPKMSTVIRWRNKAPENFEFTVKAHQDISHKFKFDVEPSVKAFEQMKEICTTLKARIMLIQTPSSFRPDKLKDAHKFLDKITREGLVVVWETRGASWNERSTREKLAKTLQELDVSHVTDPFKATPTHTGELAYFRLHGLGERMYYYQYADEELKRLRKFVKPLEAKGKEVYVLFNNLVMFDDALRFTGYLKTKSFPRITGVVGLESVRRVMEGSRYPATKSVLLKKLGWRLVEVEEGKQVRLNGLLKDIPSKSYGNVEEALREVKL